MVAALVPCARTLAAQEPCTTLSGPDAEAGWAAYSANDMAAARLRFEAALQRCDNDQYARTGLAYVDLRDGETASAERRWRTVVAVQPDNVDALVGLGLVGWRSGDVDAVRTRFERVLELSPGHATAVEYLGRLTSGPEAEPPVDAADQAWVAGDLAQAMRLYQARLAADPDDETAMLRVAMMHAWQERYPEALELLDRLIAGDPGHLDARLARARVRAWTGDVSGAEREVLEVLAVQPDHPEALEALALFQSWEGDYQGALASYDDLLAIAPTQSGAQRQQAQALAWAADLDASRAAYDALIARDPDDLDARLGLARTLSFSQDFDAAIEQYDAVLERDPEDMRALTGRARTLGWAGRLVASERAGERAVEVDPNSSEAWSTLGQAYRWQGRNADARRAFERASTFSPADAEIRDQLRSVNLAFAPLARPTVTYEGDSDDNRMVTAALTAGWHPVPRLEVRAEAYHKDLDQGALLRSAQGVTLSGAYSLRPGWTLSLGLGGSHSDGTGDPSHFEYRASVRTPDRHSLGGTLALSSSALNETAWLAELGTRSSETTVAARWVPARAWRVDGTVGIGSYEGTEKNGRRSASLSASRRLGQFFSLGASLRGFSFEKDLNDGYFDPDFYGIAEVTSYWLYRPAPWTFLVELAPGMQQIRRDGPVSSAVRSNARVAYQVAPGRDVSLTVRFSSAGLVSFASSASGYRYTGFVLASSWVF